MADTVFGSVTTPLPVVLWPVVLPASVVLPLLVPTPVVLPLLEPIPVVLLEPIPVVLPPPRVLLPQVLLADVLPPVVV